MYLHSPGKYDRSIDYIMVFMLYRCVQTIQGRNFFLIKFKRNTSQIRVSITINYADQWFTQSNGCSISKWKKYIYNVPFLKWNCILTLLKYRNIVIKNTNKRSHRCRTIAPLSSACCVLAPIKPNLNGAMVLEWTIWPCPNSIGNKQ